MDKNSNSLPKTYDKRDIGDLHFMTQHRSQRRCCVININSEQVCYFLGLNPKKSGHNVNRFIL